MWSHHREIMHQPHKNYTASSVWYNTRTITTKTKDEMRWDEKLFILGYRHQRQCMQFGLAMPQFLTKDLVHRFHKPQGPVSEILQFYAIATSWCHLSHLPFWIGAVSFHSFCNTQWFFYHKNIPISYTVFWLTHSINHPICLLWHYLGSFHWRSLRCSE